ncbi:MAG TPA: glycosyltransferase [Burkholderiaceae bacterium]|nr:glycosyltransferase [Burkholderiaceae bacterium]
MIPKTLHIIWIGDATRLPRHHIESWIERHPQWDITLWDNERVAHRQWRSARHMQELGRIDIRGTVELLKLEILYDEGGVVVDADSFCVSAIPDDMLASDAFACWADEIHQPGVLSTAFIGATPRNPTLGLLLHQIVADSDLLGRPIEVSVGANRFSRSWQARGFAGIRIYPSHYFLSAQRAAAGDNVDKIVIALHERATSRGIVDRLFQMRSPLSAKAPAEPPAPATTPAPAATPSQRAAVGQALPSAQTLRVIVFSKDRPLQLHATLTSLRARCTDPERLDIKVLAFASNHPMARRYTRLMQETPFADLVCEEGFKSTLCTLVRDAKYVAFVCDDAVFVRPWSVACVLGMLYEIPNAIGVSLRLGRNTTLCYSLGRPQSVPTSVDLNDHWRACNWTKAELDFGYPLELSSSIYRVGDIWPLLEQLSYNTPNQLEEQLAAQAAAFAPRLPILVYPESSIAFCAPLNVVQSTHPNRNGARPDQSAEALGIRFDEGMRVDVEALRGHTPAACHEEVELPLCAIDTGSAPTVSVVVPCYRQAAFLPMAIASVAAQSFQDWEVLIVNDGSPDDTSQVVRSLAAQLPGRRIRLIEQANAGLANARNCGIRAARGRYLLPLDADDALDPSFLARTVAILDADPTVAVVHTDVAIFGARAGIWHTGRPFTLEHLLQENGLAYASLYRREVWERAGGYRANMSAGYEDWDFWVTAAASGFRGWHIPEPLLLYREKDEESMLASARRHDASLRAQLKLNHPELFSPEELAAARRTLAASPLPPTLAPTAATEPTSLVDTPPREPQAPKPEHAPTSAPARESRLSLPAAPMDPAATLERLRAAKLWREGTPLRLHLGCGERRLDGYVNIDLAPAATSLMKSRADIFGNVPELRFPSGSVDEIRSHHMFEHFPRVEALVLLIRWHEWLLPGGRLVIETPDIEASAQTLLSDQPFAVKMGVVRHLAGDQAENWAFHLDHWFPDRFRHTLARLGFGDVQIERRTWPRPPFLCDVIALAVKTETLSRSELLARADDLLSHSLVAREEHSTLERWRQQLRDRLAEGSALGAAAAERPASTRRETSTVDPMAWIASRGDRAPLPDIVDFNQRQRDRWIAARAASVPAGAKVLDVGAGTCPYRARFAHCEYVTHDFKRYNGEKLGGGTAYGRIDIASDITAIPASDATFDVVLCTEVLEHVPRPIEAVQEMTRLLKPGGRLLLTAPLGSGLHQLPFHYYGGFSPEWYREVARQFDLEVVSITPNGGFFRLMAQEAARAANLLAQGRGERPPDEVLRVLGEDLPRWFYALDGAQFCEQFTVGYFVEARRAAVVDAQG